MVSTIEARDALRKQLGIPFESLDRRFKGRVAIVTGAAQGIGRAIARRLAWEGCALVVNDLERQGEKLEVLARDAAAAGAEVKIVAGDATKLDVVKAVCDAGIRGFGRVDVLMNNVGGGILTPFLEKTEDDWQQEIERNLIPVLRFCQIIAPHMVERKYGRIVNVGAESVRNGLWEHASYSAAKGGVHGFTSGLARELAPHAITVNTVAPSIVDTEVVLGLTGAGLERAKKYVGLIPMARPATMGEVAAACAFVGSDDASFITGQVISVNGGSSML